MAVCTRCGSEGDVGVSHHCVQPTGSMEPVWVCCECLAPGDGILELGACGG